MAIDLKLVRDAKLPVTRSSWSANQVILYHLGVGAGLEKPTDAAELQYTYEKVLKVLPTFAVIPVNEALVSLRALPGLSINWRMVLHGEQEIEIMRPIPVSASAVHEARVASVQDKGSAALIVLEVVTSVNGEPVFINRVSIFARGEGGFGGESGPKAPNVELPGRAPDAVIESPTLPNQALLYRLTGDDNALHADPSFAQRAGFERPILHGLCSYGILCKAAVDAMLGGDVTQVARYQARFSGVMFPGETIVTSLWKEGSTILVSAKTKERNSPVVSNTVITLRP